MMKPSKKYLKSMSLIGLLTCFSIPVLSSRVMANDKPYIGLSAFAAMNRDFPCGRYLQTMQDVNKPAMSILWGTFGSDKGCMTRFLQQNINRPHLLQIHLSNQTCYDALEESRGNRARQCARGELIPYDSNDTSTHITSRRFNEKIVAGDRDLIGRIEQRLTNIKTWVDNSRNANTMVVITTGLEDNYNRGAYRRIVELMKAAGLTTENGYRLARNPESPEYKPFQGVDYLELHPGSVSNLGRFPRWDSGNRPVAKPGKCIANLDGVSTPRAEGVNNTISVNQSEDFVRRHQDCFAVFLWNAPLQGYVISGDRYAPNETPRDREFSLGNIRRLRNIMTTWN